jgi:hypothetical protein
MVIPDMWSNPPEDPSTCHRLARPHMWAWRREDSLTCKPRKSWRIKAARISLPYYNWLEIGFPIVTDLDFGLPTLSVAQYKAGKGVLPGTRSTQARSSCNLATPAIQTKALYVGFNSPEARTSIKLPCPLCLAMISVCYSSITIAFLALDFPAEQINHRG